jgi:hypothetical protein
MSLHQLMRSQSQPLAQADVLVAVGLEDLQIAKRDIPCVLDVVAIGGGRVAYVTSL